MNALGSKKKYLIGLPFVVGACVGLVGCESKSVDEKPVDVRPTEELSLDERLKLQERIDTRFDQMTSVARKILRTIDHVRKTSIRVLGTGNPNGEYTPFDFILDLNDAFKGKLPKGIRRQDGTHVAYTSLQLPSSLVTEECRALDARMTAYVDAQAEVAAVEYALNSCSDRSTYVTVANLAWAGDMSFALDEAGLKTVFGGAFEKSIGDQVGCTAKAQDTDYYKSVELHCAKLSLKLASEVDLKVADLAYVDFGTKAVAANGQIFEKGEHKADLTVYGTTDGQVGVELRRAGETSEILSSN